MGGSKTIEDQYQKLSNHEHVLKKPTMYIGSIRVEKCPMWIFNTHFADNQAKIIQKDIEYVPGLYKIYDEILVNARDHSIRCASCDTIKVSIDKDVGKITVWNNGKGIDVVEHKVHKTMIPSMIFGELMTSTNFDEKEKRIVGGTNGLGAKLVNIWSTEFCIETVDSKRKLKFYQKYTNNMYTVDKAKIKSTQEKSFTSISFVPDYKRFGMSGMTDDMFALFKKRVYDIAMNTKCKVYFNNTLISDNTFTKYIDLYFPEQSEHKKVIDLDDNWKVCVIYDPTDTIEHQNISFVNGICTYQGGSHVDYISNQIVNELKKAITKKIKDGVVKPAMIKENLIFFVDSI
ncbi:hypothetical protein EON71_01220, partial [bacterium]